MTLTPAERAALNSFNDGHPHTIHTVISGFENDTDAVFLLVPVPHGPGYSIGDRVTITLEENE